MHNFSNILNSIADGKKLTIYDHVHMTFVQLNFDIRHCLV